MAEYRLSAKMIGRSSGRSSVAAAAYRAGAQLTDERTGEIHDYTRKRGVLHSEILAPENTPDWMKDRAKLWNAVETVERRKDAQLSREIQFSLPHELDEDQNREMLLAFVQTHFVERGMVADVAMHAPDRGGDRRNIHAHVMLSTRVLTGGGFGKKNREWNTNDQLVEWRKSWADHQNAVFQELGMEQRVDHRSYEDQGVDREPTQHLGPVANDMEKKGKSSRVGDENRERQQRNAERAALAQKSAETSRNLALEQARQNQKESTQKAVMQSHLLDEEIQLGRRHDLQSTNLETQQQRQNAEWRQQLEAEQKHLQQQLKADGWQKLMRDLLGKTRKDLEQLQATQRNLDGIRQREAAEIQALQDRQEAERQVQQAAHRQRDADYAAKLEADRQTALERAREPDNAAPAPTPSSDMRKPFWRRQKAPEQDNGPEITQDFNNASQQAPEPLQATDKQKAIEDHKARMRERLAKGRERGRDGYDYD